MFTLTSFNTINREDSNSFKTIFNFIYSVVTNIITYIIDNIDIIMHTINNINYSMGVMQIIITSTNTFLFIFDFRYLSSYHKDWPFDQESYTYINKDSTYKLIMGIPY